ncbi:MAG: flagellar motor switch protein FliG [Planctomycetaceae bacterium]
MDNIRKAAILLLNLDKPLAAEVLSQMPRDLVESVTLEIAKLDDVTQEQRESVLNEFCSLAEQNSHIDNGSVDVANDVLQQPLEKDGSGKMPETVRQSMNLAPFGFLQQAGADNLVTFIVEEHPQTIALIMSHLPAPLAAEVLSGLPSTRQLDVIRRVANMEPTSPEVVRDVQSSLENRMKSTLHQQHEKAGGITIVAQILNVTDRMTNKGILENLEQEDAGLVEEIRRLMFVFDDLLKLDDQAMQTLLKEVDNNQWAVALKGANEEIQSRVMGNLSQRAAELLEKEMEFLSPIKVSDVEAMQQQIVDIVRRLEDAGQIEILTRDEQFVA